MVSLVSSMVRVCKPEAGTYSFGRIHANFSSHLGNNAFADRKSKSCTLKDVYKRQVPIIDNRGYIHIISDKAIYYIVKQDGSLLASAELGVKCTSSPVMDSRGYLYIGIEAVAGASDMVCISSGATSYAASAWPMKGQNPQRTGLQK